MSQIVNIVPFRTWRKDIGRVKSQHIYIMYNKLYVLMLHRSYINKIEE